MTTQTSLIWEETNWCFLLLTCHQLQETLLNIFCVAKIFTEKSVVMKALHFGRVDARDVRSHVSLIFNTVASKNLICLVTLDTARMLYFHRRLDGKIIDEKRFSTQHFKRDCTNLQRWLSQAAACDGMIYSVNYNGQNSVTHGYALPLFED